MLRIAFFGGSGEGTMVPLSAVAAQYRIVALVRPGNTSRAKSAVRSLLSCASLSHDAMTDYARQYNVPVIHAASGRDPQIGRRLAELGPIDVICVSAFPWIIEMAILSTARLGAINVHPSLLPRHRGPVPLFWTYYHDDGTTGVTVHRMTEHADAGDILAQQSVALPRGYSVSSLHAENAQRAARLLVGVLQRVEANALEPKPQDERLVTYAPRVSLDTPMVNFNEWHVERVWHFLSGLCAHYREPLRDGQGRAAAYRSILGYETGVNGRPAGTVEPMSGGWRVHCRGGVVLLGHAESGGKA